jgi:hypothetical protein
MRIRYRQKTTKLRIQNCPPFMNKIIKKDRFLEFITDFMRRLSALTVIGLVLFIVIPVLLLILKIGTYFVFPISVLGAVIILIALLRSS